MRLHDWLSQEEGRATRLAAEFGVSKSAISQWRAVGAPVRCFRRIVDISAGVVTLDDLVKDKEGGRPDFLEALQQPAAMVGVDNAPEAAPTQEASHAA